MTILRGIFGTFIVIALTAVSVINLQHVEFSYSPVHDAVTLPAYTLILGGVLVGFLMGAILMWLNTFARHRRHRKTIKALEKALRRAEKAAEHSLTGKTSSSDTSSLVETGQVDMID